jgi:hypothetical protein
MSSRTPDEGKGGGRGGVGGKGDRTMYLTRHPRKTKPSFFKRNPQTQTKNNYTGYYFLLILKQTIISAQATGATTGLASSTQPLYFWKTNKIKHKRKENTLSL